MQANRRRLEKRSMKEQGIDLDLKWRGHTVRSVYENGRALPAGYVWSGEFRLPKRGEQFLTLNTWTLYVDCALHDWGVSPRLILRKIEPEPLVSEVYGEMRPAPPVGFYYERGGLSPVAIGDWFLEKGHRRRACQAEAGDEVLGKWRLKLRKDPKFWEVYPNGIEVPKGRTGRFRELQMGEGAEIIPYLTGRGIVTITVDGLVGEWRFVLDPKPEAAPKPQRVKAKEVGYIPKACWRAKPPKGYRWTGEPKLKVDPPRNSTWSLVLERSDVPEAQMRPEKYTTAFNGERHVTGWWRPCEKIEEPPAKAEVPIPAEAWRVLPPEGYDWDGPPQGPDAQPEVGKEWAFLCTNFAQGFVCGQWYRRSYEINCEPRYSQAFWRHVKKQAPPQPTIESVYGPESTLEKLVPKGRKGTFRRLVEGEKVEWISRYDHSIMQVVANWGDAHDQDGWRIVLAPLPPLPPTPAGFRHRAEKGVWGLPKKGEWYTCSYPSGKVEARQASVDYPDELYFYDWLLDKIPAPPPPKPARVRYEVTFERVIEEGKPAHREARAGEWVDTGMYGFTQWPIPDCFGLSTLCYDIYRPVPATARRIEDAK